MRKINYLMIACALGLASCATTKSPAELAAENAADSIAHVQVISLLDSMDFILRASQVQIKGGTLNYTDNESTNFICANDGVGTLQLASMRNPGPGFNGLGGLTIRGEIKLIRKAVDKGGRATYEYNLNAPVASCRIVVTVPKNGTRAVAMISGNFRGGTVTVMGPVTPYDPTTIAFGSYIGR